MVSEVWRVAWRNFRGYAKKTSIDFPSLTLLIGRNNVGKTSAYAPLLLLRQTLEAKNPETALLFKGSSVDFGSYRDIVTDHDESKTISFNLELGPPGAGLQRREDGPEIGSVDLTFGPSDTHGAVLKKSVVQARDGSPIITRSRQPSGRYKLDSALINNVPGRPFAEVSQVRKLLEGEQPKGFLFDGVSGLLLPSMLRNDEDKWSRVRGLYEAATEIYDIYRRVNSTVKRELGRLSYIGPIRSAPLRSYLKSPERPTDVGADGRWAMEVLFREHQSGSSGVFERTNTWLQLLGYGTLEFDAQGDYFRAFIRRPGSHVVVNLADCGMGLAQLLPILVQGSLLLPDSSLIVQQPEIHLNPAQQDILTDFLIDLARQGTRVVVETHSEHVLSRLRRRMAENETLKDTDVALYFCDSLNDRSTVTPIPIGALGEIQSSDWPVGFFNQQLQNSLAMASAQAKSQKRIHAN